MNLLSFFSGGKDSTYSIFLAKGQGHSVKCLLTALPHSDESKLLHHSNISWTRLQSQSMQIPQVTIPIVSDAASDESTALEQVLLHAKDVFDVDGLVHGGISSEFQRSRFDSVCKKHGLKVVSPLWGSDPLKYMRRLLDDGFEYVITSVSSGGLDDSWLGRPITYDDLDLLDDLSKKHGFNLNFEGGEAETYVTDCPLFSKPIEIRQGKNSWDGYRGMFEIVDAILVNNA